MKVTGAAIFDLDGTLVESAKVAVASFNEAFRRCGLSGEPPADAFVALSGVPLKKVCEILGLPESFPEQFRTAARERQGDLALFPQIIELLEELAAHAVPMGILTGKDRERTIETLQFLTIDKFFSALVTPDDDPRPKPAPDGIWWLCDQLRSDVRKSCVIGDAEADMQAARAAAAEAVGCTWGVASRPVLAEAGADVIVETVADLRAHLAAKFDMPR